MISLDLLRTFLAVYRLGSVTKAAAQLSITQPAASGRLQALENSLRRPLFVHAGRRLSPTAAAHDLARAIGPYLDGLEAVVSSTLVHGSKLAAFLGKGGCCQKLRPRTCSLRASPAEFMSARVLPALAQLGALGIRLSVRLGLAQDLITALATGELDLAIATVRIPHEAIEYRQLFREEFVLVGAPKWAAQLAGQRGAVAERLATFPLLAYAEDLPIVRCYWREVFGEEPGLRASLLVADLRALIRAAAAGAGITVVPRYLCEAELADGSLAHLHRPPRPPHNTIHLAWNKYALRHPRNAFVRDALLNAARGWAA